MRAVTLRSHHLAVLSTLAWGCGAPTRPPAAPAAAPDNVRAPDAVLAQLHPRSAERWTLRRADGSYVCTLPCAYWVRPDDELHLELEGSPGTLPTEKTAYELPRPLPANPGEQLTLTVDRQHGFGLMGKVVAAPLAVVLGLFGVTITTLATVSLATGSKHVTSRTSVCASASRNSIVSPVARHDSLNASAVISWKAILHAERAIDLTQCGMEHMDSPVNGYLALCRAFRVLALGDACVGLRWTVDADALPAT